MFKALLLKQEENKKVTAVASSYVASAFVTTENE